MDHQDLRTLKFLQAIESGQSTSQRDLAQQFNISLGLVNSFIKRLALKGYFKITSIPRNRVAYILTPQGAAEKTRLTYEYIYHSYRFYRDIRNQIIDRYKELTAAGSRCVVFLGLSDLAEIAYLYIQQVDLKLVGILDDQSEGQRFFNFKVLRPDRLPSTSYDSIVVTSIDTGTVNRQIETYNLAQSKVRHIGLGDV